MRPQTPWTHRRGGRRFLVRISSELKVLKVLKVSKREGRGVCALNTYASRSHTGVRGNEAADALAKKGTQIGDRARIVEWNSAEPPYEKEEHLDNG